jgi:hypothetical protein
MTPTIIRTMMMLMRVLIISKSIASVTDWLGPHPPKQ